jgi:hypothetical protein
VLEERVETVTQVLMVLCMVVVEAGVVGQEPQELDILVVLVVLVEEEPELQMRLPLLTFLVVMGQLQVEAVAVGHITTVT